MMNFRRVLAPYAMLLVLALPCGAKEYYVAKTGSDTNPGTQTAPFLTVQQGVNAAQPGDRVLVAAGSYEERVSSLRDGLAGSPIIIDGQSAATIHQLYIAHAHHQILNLTLSGATAQFSSLLWLRRGAHYTSVSNVLLDAKGIANVSGISWEAPSTTPFGQDAASLCAIVHNRITGMLACAALTIFGSHNVIKDNDVYDLGQADFVRLFGESNIISGNVFRNIFLVPGEGNHIDFIQTFGENGFGSRGHVIEKNLIRNIEGGQLAQLETYMVPEIREWTFRNNIFAHIALQSSCTVPEMKFYNNTFYRCNTNGAAALTFGSRTYPHGTSRAHGTRLFNNVFLECGDPTSTSKGWYSVATELTNCITDYNFVAKANYQPVRQGTIPVGDGTHDVWRFYEIHGINGGDPDFINPAGLNFDLQEGSFLVDAGATMEGFNDDALGTTRPQGGGWDIGPYEFALRSNTPPQVSADADRGMQWPTNQLVLAGSVTDDGLPAGGTLAIQWAMVSGPQPVTFSDPSAPDTTATFPTTGIYLLRLAAADGELSASDDVTVVVNAAPTPLPKNAFYVSKDGNDSNPGTSESPWLTIGRAALSLAAGDTVIIRDGDYDEHVEGKASGEAGNYITFRSENIGGASLRAFRLRGQFIRLSGLTLSRFSGVNSPWDAAVRVEATAHNSVIENCVIKDAPFVIAHDFRFDHTRNEIISESSDFVAAGFQPGSRVYLGSSGLEGLYYANHDTTWTVSSLTPHSMQLANAGSTFLEDNGSNYWAVVRAGSLSGGPYAINCVVSGGAGPTNLLISDNTISNWIGNAIGLNGNGSIVENNYLTKLHSFRFLSFSGNNHVICGNVVKNSPNILHYTGEEISTLVHPAGTGWYDYQVGMLSGFTSSTMSQNTNILVERNWFENIENQLGRVDDEQDGTFGITYRNNVFIGVSDHFSGGRDEMRWISNTFYRCAWNIAHPLQVGGRAPAQSGYEITHNLFIACGPKGLSETQNRGFYSISDNALDPLAEYNMVASEEVTGWAAKTDFFEQHGVNGGDPVFLSILEFAGQDGIPFTPDDGLQVLPNSPAAALGCGALGTYALTPDAPVAHFTVAAPAGWFEPVGDAYNPEWLAMLPTTRGGVQRRFDTPVMLGDVPLAVTFDASDSISGVNGSLANTDITLYTWDFGDGSTATSEVPTISHTFTSPGDKLIRLTVQNSAGQLHSMKNIYRFGGSTPGVPILPAPGKLRKFS